MEDLYSSTEIHQLLEEINKFLKAREKRDLLTPKGLLVWVSQNFDENIYKEVKKLVA